MNNVYFYFPISYIHLFATMGFKALANILSEFILRSYLFYQIHLVQTFKFLLDLFLF